MTCNQSELSLISLRVAGARRGSGPGRFGGHTRSSVGHVGHGVGLVGRGLGLPSRLRSRGLAHNRFAQQQLGVSRDDG